MTTTSYALLVQLSLRARSAYELAVTQERYFRFFWPRAARAVYNEVKRLDALGFAEAATSFTGRRSRTTYAITPAGRAALGRWLRSDLTPLGLEFEGLLRIHGARLGTLDDLRANFERIRADVATMTALNDRIIGEYHDGVAPFQHDAHLRTLVVDFFTQFLDQTARWVDRCLAEVDTWQDLSPQGKELPALARIHRQRFGATAGGAAKRS